METASPNKYWYWVEKAGIVLVTMSVIVFLLTFFPVVKEELKYQFFPKHKNATVVTRTEENQMAQAHQALAGDIINPVDEEFGIVIPALSANARVIGDIDWENAAAYQRALTRGVVHAKGTSHPGEPGNVFIFAHSGVDFYEAIRYNAEFYLLSKLTPGDLVYLFYQKQKYTYRVTGKKTVAPEEVGILTDNTALERTLTLMTCTPAGTTFKRLIVTANQVDNN
jgi:LPXTG-site transpeptidase (sortase) family protein